MAFMHKTPGHAAWSAIEIFVAAPAGEIDVPVMERQGNVAGGMSEIPANHTAFGVPSFGDAFDLIELAGVVVDGADHY